MPAHPSQVIILPCWWQRFTAESQVLWACQLVRLIQQRRALSNQLLRLLIVNHLAAEGRTGEQSLHLRCERIALCGQRLDLPFDRRVGRIARVDACNVSIANVPNEAFSCL